MSDQLTIFLMAAIKRPFLWGRSDCFILASEWIKQKTKQDIFAGYEFENNYNTSKGAVRLYRLYKFKSIEEIWEHFLTPVDVNKSQRGDICVRKIAGFEMPASGIVLDKGLSAFQSLKGLSLYPTGENASTYEVPPCLP